MLTKIQTNTLRNFVVRDDTLSYDNEYNTELLRIERQEAVQAASRLLVHNVATYTGKAFKRLGMASLNALDTYIQSAQHTA